MAIAVPIVAAPAPPVISTAVSEASFDERWGAWRAKNAAHERDVRRRMAVAVPILLVVAAVVYFLLVR